ncbi:unnamed protein product [Gongylonema pulchrum]|uniref:RPN1_RPN2_N domain-containing protein n=1 Tax=Gongylonema pulchrum TaxID=637853 RepID=A0A183E3V8_9BILA|nr:unnamed protein product [Gongylonema pulchrum]
MEMAEEWRAYSDGTEAHNKRRDQLLTLTREIVVHNMKHNAEVEACDLLIEIERLDLLSEYVEEIDHGRVCLYLLRHLAMEMAEEWRAYSDGTEAHNKRRDQLLTLTREIVVHNMKHNAEVEACDLLIEIERLDLLSEYVEEIDHGRVCLYLLSCSPLMPDPDNEILIKTAMNIYRKFGKNFDALRCAIMLNAVSTMREIVLETKDV